MTPRNLRGDRANTRGSDFYQQAFWFVTASTLRGQEFDQILFFNFICELPAKHFRKNLRGSFLLSLSVHQVFYAAHTTAFATTVMTSLSSLGHEVIAKVQVREEVGQNLMNIKGVCLASRKDMA